MTDSLVDAKSDEFDGAGETLAARAKAVRKAKGLTIQRVADRSGLAISTISKIERNRMTPTYDCFRKLARGLEVELAELVADGESGLRRGETAVSRRGEVEYRMVSDTLHEVLFTELADKRMVPTFATLKPSKTHQIGGHNGRAGEEFVLVLKGSVRVDLEGGEPIVLQTGESLYLDSRRAHRFATATDRSARILCVWSGADGIRSLIADND